MLIADQSQLDFPVLFTGQEHALAFMAQHLAWLQVGYGQHLLVQQLSCIWIELADAGQDLAGIAVAKVQVEEQQLA